MNQKFEFLKNPSLNKWVILAPKRESRPHDRKTTNLCPFCSGNEGETPAEVYRLGTGEENRPGWQIRVVPNKYPFAPIHEVIIHSPDHKASFFNYSPQETEKIFQVYKERYNLWKERGKVVIFYNRGEEAGESRVHNHTQLAVIPEDVEVENISPAEPENIVHQSTHFDIFMPTASQWPYETWFLPKKRGMLFGDTGEEEIKELANIFLETVKRLREALSEDFPFNFYIYHDIDWYLRLIPRLKKPAGFELATGIYVNTKDPQEAAKEVGW